MNGQLRELAEMFYPLSDPEQQRWAAILSLPEPEYRSALANEADRRGLKQRSFDDALAWLDEKGHALLLLFRIPDPGDLGRVRAVYETIAASDAPLAYTFVHQIADGEGTWDIFHMSRLTYLAHCNRVSGPGSASAI